MIPERTKIVAALMAILAAAAASSEVEARTRKFSCPMPDKRTCMSTSQVYEATNNGAELDERGAIPAVMPAPQPLPRPIEPVKGLLVETPNRCCNPVRTEITVQGDTLAVASPVVAPQHGSQYEAAPTTTTYAMGAYEAPRTVQTSRQELVVRTAREEPFRVPAKVMRIYISPWEDEQGDLHMGGYVFSEIAPRKWSVGNRAAPAGDGLRLLTLSQPSRDAAQEAKNGQSDATAQTARAE